ncbi:MAG TPA: glycosyltransferase [Pyrinomonadaceae bacterium]
MTSTPTGKRILLTTFGSFGDIHPYIAIALELKRRGHSPLLVTSEVYREKIASEDLDFAPMRPNLPGPDEPQEMLKVVRKVMDLQKGTEFLIKELLLPALRESYEDLNGAAEDADLIVTHPITFAGPLVAQKRKLPWASSLLAPASFFSATDPFVIPQAPWFVKLRPLGIWPFRILNSVVHKMTEKWMKPVAELRAELGLHPARNPLFEGQHSPQLVLALFSKVMGEPQADWPAATRLTGFPFYDRRDETVEGQGLSTELREFLDAGPPPIVFTLGSSAVWVAGDFYRESIRAAKLLDQRALLLIGSELNKLNEPLPDGIAAFEYAPYGELLPRASVIVHQGGVGTTGQSLRAGRPMLVVPFNHDQPDNAMRVTRLGVARTLGLKDYRAARVAVELGLLLNDDGYQRRAAEVGQLVCAENGAANAADALEELLSENALDKERGELSYAS